ncbi:hypothetical protein [Polaromonas sp.]|uniref:hypothetical protein n=1 Tax=Polaromonas sp. TaxID=1869339 RepID=UPI001800007E|nr:hypothetical protein [Polaromonas sp.]NMM05998.1 hypothetical protein [Polaromonas sp.]
MKRRVFIVERPLQILIVFAILDQLEDDCVNDILVANCFHGAAEVVSRFNNLSTSGINYMLFGDYKKAFLFAEKNKYEEIFIHWDIGFRTSIRLNRLNFTTPRSKIYVFEEGAGTYRDDLYTGIKKRIFSKIGVAINNGGHNKIDGIFLYSPEYYRLSVSKPAKSIVQINLNVSEVIEQNDEFLIAIFDGTNFIKKLKIEKSIECVIYLSNWCFSPSDLDFIQNSKSTKILKLHPHIKIDHTNIRSDFIVCPNGIPAELLISKLQTLYEKITIFHHGSSVARYVNSNSTKFIDLRIPCKN